MSGRNASKPLRSIPGFCRITSTKLQDIRSRTTGVTLQISRIPVSSIRNLVGVQIRPAFGIEDSNELFVLLGLGQLFPVGISFSASQSSNHVVDYPPLAMSAVNPTIGVSHLQCSVDSFFRSKDEGCSDDEPAGLSVRPTILDETVGFPCRAKNFSHVLDVRMKFHQTSLVDPRILSNRLNDPQYLGIYARRSTHDSPEYVTARIGAHFSPG